MNRSAKLAISLISLLFLGLIYGWSIFVGPLEAEFGWERGATSLTFAISVAANILCGFVGTSLRDKVPGGTRTCLILGAALICAGFVCSSLWPSIAGFYLFYGVVCGGGIGLAYMSVLGSVPSLFPDRIGLVSGMLAMAYGMGALVLGAVCSQLLDAFGWRFTFRLVGVAFAAILVLEALVLGGTSADGMDSAAPSPTIALDDVVRDKRTWGVLLWTLLPTAAGLSVTGQVVPCAVSLGIPTAIAVLVSGGVSLGNGLGRVLFGAIADRFDIFRSMPLASALLVAGAALSTAGMLLGAAVPFVAGVFMLGLSFGSCPSTSAFSARRFFGIENYALALGVLNLQVVLASVVGPWVAGILYSATGSYAPMFVEICVLATVSLAVLAWHLGNVRATDEHGGLRGIASSEPASHAAPSPAKALASAQSPETLLGKRFPKDPQ